MAQRASDIEPQARRIESVESNEGSQEIKRSEGSLEGRRGEYIGDVMQKAVARRAFLRGTGATGAALVLAPAALAPKTSEATGAGWWSRFSQGLSFQAVPAERFNPDIVVPEGYEHNVIIKWGDGLHPGVPNLEDMPLEYQSPQTQSLQFGFNADLVLWFPLPEWVRWGQGHLSPLLQSIFGLLLPYYFRSSTRRSLMWVNHEYTQGVDMFPGYTEDNPTDVQMQTEIEAHGGSVIEIAQDWQGKWRFVQNSPFNRRITGTTRMDIAGPLRGHDLMKTSLDPAGETVFGMFNNCAGGKTMWGTVLTCEENFDQYFGRYDQVPDEPNKRLSDRIAAESEETDRKWERLAAAGLDPRFDLSTDANEYHRHGYVIEIDPYDPYSVPRKRTALGRFKHEGAVPTLTKDGRVAVYSGDDARFEYVYKFVTDGQFKSHDRAHNMTLLDEGTLYVARFDAGAVDGDEMGIGEWLPLVWEAGNVLHQAGFNSQAEVLLNPRGAADELGATPMDRPEDIDVSPKTGHVFVALTNNSARAADDTDDANPRGPNPHGHVLELIEDGDDAAATTFRWNVFIKCGDPAVPEHETRFGDIADPAAAGVSPISDPDNVVFDDDGNLWISTDGQWYSGSVGFGQSDGVFAVPVTGANRGLLKQFFAGIPGGEVCGPEFSGDNRTFFCAIQHPHDGTAFDPVYDDNGTPVVLPKWPIGEMIVTRPSLVAIRHQDGRKIGR
jgi:hypothetical protein